jgi:flagellar assembly factor FliW
MVWGVKQRRNEFGAKPTDHQELNIVFKHTIYAFEEVEEFELDEFLSSQLNYLKTKY